VIHALIVDDEPLARRGIRVRLERAGGVEVIGECASGSEAVSVIRHLEPDLVFLDVQMPGLDGFGVVDQVGADRMPPVVFVTAYDAHALRAFDVHALDYLLKPIDDERFDTAVERAKRRVAERQVSGTGYKLAAALDDLRPRRILIKDRGRVVILNEADVDWVEAEGDYVRVHAAGRGHLLRETMAAMEERLDPTSFARIHRSTIVNVSRIRELKPHPNREFTVVLKDRTQLRLSRSYRDALRGHLGDGL
jgi:two-component system, LytTR family, response regulator